MGNSPRPCQPWRLADRPTVLLLCAPMNRTAQRASDFTESVIREMTRVANEAGAQRTRAIVINTPDNPTGRLLSRIELEGLATLCIQFGLLAFTDEIYARGCQRDGPGGGVQ